MKVLYVNHTGKISGAERSLLNLLNGLPKSIAPAVACPGTGPLASAIRKLQLPVMPIPEIRGSLKLHPWHTPLTVFAITRAALAVRRAARVLGADLIDANSTRAGLVAILARRLGGPPVIVHVKDCLPTSHVANVVRRLIGSGAAMILANSRYTATNFRSRGCHAPVLVVYNTVDLDRFDPGTIARDKSRDTLGLDRSAPLLGVIAQIAPWKGQADVIHALAHLRGRRPTAQLLLVGEATFSDRAARYDTKAYRRFLRQLVQDLGIAGAVHFLGERQDIPEILRALDLLLVPSWEEPFGLTTIEAMAMETPLVATNVGGPTEIIRHGEDGLLLPPRQPDRWAKAIDGLIAQPALRAEMGRNGRLRVKAEFSSQRYVERTLAAYRATLRGESVGALLPTDAGPAG